MCSQRRNICCIEERRGSGRERFKEVSYYESDEIKKGLTIDYDKLGNVIGIEILDASEYLTEDELATIKFDISRAVIHK